jgi:hypothetical protein
VRRKCHRRCERGAQKFQPAASVASFDEEHTLDQWRFTAATASMPEVAGGLFDHLVGGRK